MTDLKTELYKLCVNYVQERIDAAADAIKSARESANEETKSSAGDKYETSREMMQQEGERNQAQLNEAKKLMTALNNVNQKPPAEAIEAGSLVVTNNGKFYLAISAGTLTFNNENFFAISPASPIGLKLKGLRPGDGFDLNGKNYKVESIS